MSSEDSESKIPLFGGKQDDRTRKQKKQKKKGNQYQSVSSEENERTRIELGTLRTEDGNMRSVATEGENAVTGGGTEDRNVSSEATERESAATGVSTEDRNVPPVATGVESGATEGGNQGATNLIRITKEQIQHWQLPQQAEKEFYRNHVTSRWEVMSEEQMKNRYFCPSTSNTCIVRTQPLTQQSPYFQFSVNVSQIYSRIYVGLVTKANSEHSQNGGKELSIVYSGNGKLHKNGASNTILCQYDRLNQVGCGIKFEMLADGSYAEPLDVFFTVGQQKIGPVSFFSHGENVYPMFEFEDLYECNEDMVESLPQNILTLTSNQTEPDHTRNNRSSHGEFNSKKYQEVYSKADIRNALERWQLKENISFVLSFCGKGGKTFACLQPKTNFALVQLIRYTGALITCSASAEAASIVTQIVNVVHAVSNHKPKVLGVLSLPQDGKIKDVCMAEINEHITHFVFVNYSDIIDTYHMYINTNLSEGVASRNDFVVPVLSIHIDEDEEVFERHHEHVPPILLMKPNLKYDDITKTLMSHKNPMVDQYKLSIVLLHKLQSDFTDTTKNEALYMDYDTNALATFVLEQDLPDCFFFLIGNVLDLRTYAMYLRDKTLSSLTLLQNSFDKKEYEYTEKLSYLFLFIWAIEKEKYNVAVALCKCTESAMTSSLVAVEYLQDKLKLEHNHEKKEVLKTQIEIFNDLALSSIHMYYAASPSKAKQCLVYQRENFGQVSTLLLAQENKVFLNHPACRSKIEDIWNGTTNDSEKSLNVKERFVKYATAPFAQCFYTCAAYLIFLCLFAFRLVSTRGTAFSTTDYVLVFFFINFPCEQGIQAIIKKKKYCGKWKLILFDILTIVTFVTGMVLQKTCCFEGGVVVLTFDYILFSIRFLYALSGVGYIGVKLVMIWEMLRDLGSFFIILIVAVMSNGVAMQIIMYPSSSISWKTVLDIYSRSYLSLFGEYFLDELEEEFDCSNDEVVWMNGTLPRCPTMLSRQVVPIMLEVYLLIVNILLLNLLIAMFNFTFAKVYEDVEIYMIYLRYRNVKEYHCRHWICLYPTFGVIYIVGRLVWNKCKGKQETVLGCSERNSMFCELLDHRSKLQLWEQFYDMRSSRSNLETEADEYDDDDYDDDGIFRHFERPSSNDREFMQNNKN